MFNASISISLNRSVFGSLLFSGDLDKGLENASDTGNLSYYRSSHLPAEPGLFINRQRTYLFDDLVRSIDKNNI